MRSFGLVMVSVLVLAPQLVGCASESAPVEDGIDERFLGPDGKDDTFGVADGSPDARGVLRVVNELSRDDLAGDVRVSARVAGGIAGHRDGPDGLAGTTDDDAFDTLGELDAIPYVGRATFERILGYARDHGYVDEAGTPDAADDGSDGGGDVTGVCAREHAGSTSDGEPVTICDELHATRPFVRLPADERAGDTITLHAALVLGGNSTLVDRSGTAHLIVDSAGAAVLAEDIPGARMPSYRHWYLTYRVTGTLTTWVNPYSGASFPAIRIATLAPEVLIDGHALDGRMLGTWEGTMAPRTGDGTWELGGTVPVRVTFDRLDPRPNIPVIDPSGATLPDGNAFDIVGRVDNLDAGVRGADGTCLASLTSLGERNPLDGASTDALTLWRLGGMHARGDSQLVIEFPDGTQLGVGMGDVAPVAAQGAILIEGPETWAAGSHNSWQFSVDLRRVSSGGASCSP